MKKMMPHTINLLVLSVYVIQTREKKTSLDMYGKGEKLTFIKVVRTALQLGIQTDVGSLNMKEIKISDVEI